MNSNYLGKCIFIVIFFLVFFYKRTIIPFMKAIKWENNQGGEYFLQATVNGWINRKTVKFLSLWLSLHSRFENSLLWPNSSKLGNKPQN